MITLHPARFLATTGTLPGDDGLGTLSDVISCTATLAAGQYDLSMIYPLKGMHGNRIREDMILCCSMSGLRSGNGDHRQLFRITKLRKYEDAGTEYLEAIADHISCDLNFTYVSPDPITTKDPATAMRQMLSNRVNPNQVFTFDALTGYAEDAQTIDLGRYYSLWEGFTKIEELFPDVTFERSGLRIDLLVKGQAPGVEAVKGKNLQNAAWEVSLDGVYTGVYVYYKSGDEFQPATGPYRYEGDNPYGVPRYYMLNAIEFVDFAPDLSVMRSIGETWLKYHNSPLPKRVLSGTILTAEKPIYIFDKLQVDHETFGIYELADIQRIQYDICRDKVSGVEIGGTLRDITDVVLETKKEIQGVNTLITNFWMTAPEPEPDPPKPVG